jgi:hypothetical protein
MGAKRAVVWKAADDGAERLGESGCLSHRTPASHDRRGRARAHLERDQNVTDTGQLYQLFSRHPLPVAGGLAVMFGPIGQNPLQCFPGPRFDAQHVARQRSPEGRDDQRSGTAPGGRVNGKVGR